MKRIAILSGFFLLWACSNDFLEPPKKLLSEKQMESILYDFATLNAMSSSYKPMLEERGVVPSKIIFEWYGIDSLEFAENDLYYASKPKEYLAIYKKVLDRMTADKSVLDSLVKIELKRKEEERMNSIKRIDSLQKDSILKDSIRRLKKKKIVPPLPRDPS